MKGTEPATKAGAEALEYFTKSTNANKKVAVGLSGGVDSSLAAAILVEAGWEVEGLTLWLMSGKGACCSEGLVDAAGICKQLGILHHIVDSRGIFEKEIVQELVNGYKRGITPLPCSKCNKSVKFSNMINWAVNERNIEKIATGHYARIRNSDCKNIEINLPGDSRGRIKLLRGIDIKKDQSYFLYDLPQDILERTIFPLGELTKEETRIEASRFNLRTANKPESQDLCLVEHHGSMKAFLDKYIPPRKGNIILEDGTILGHHDGIEHFTIGQRKGLGISWEKPLHVIRLNPISNEVIVSTRENSGRSKCKIDELNWVSISPPEEEIDVEVQIRYRCLPVKAKLRPIKEESNTNINNPCLIIFNEEQFSITPGQAAVLYSGEVLLGGGLIQEI